MVGLKIGPIFYKIGNGSLLHGFFSTVAYHLEETKWGSRFPLLMNNLYHKELKHDEVADALQELEDIQEGLKAFPPKAVIWDIEDLDKNPPWGDNVSERITDLSNYFYTSDGKNLFEVFKEALETSKKVNKTVVIKSL